MTELPFYNGEIKLVGEPNKSKRQFAKDEIMVDIKEWMKKLIYTKRQMDADILYELMKKIK